MSTTLEFHGSEVRAVDGEGDRLRIVFSAAHVHRRADTPAVDGTSGYLQPVTLTLSGATWTADLDHCVGRISAGAVRVDGHEIARLPVPTELSGAVAIAIDVVFSNAARLLATAAGVSVTAGGNARFFEDFSC